MVVPNVQDRKDVPHTDSYDLDDETFVPFCTKFKYLGSIITSDLDDTTEIERRLSHAQMAFNTLRKILCNQRLHVDRRRQLYQMCVLSVLLAGCETWAVKPSHLQALASFHNKCTRTMCGINLRHCQMHKISTKSILERLDILPIDTIFYIRQLRFLHRVASIEQTGLATRGPGAKLEEWIPKIRSSICATLAEETLELPTGSIKFKTRPMHPHRFF